MSSESAINTNGARTISPAKLSHAVLRTTRLKAAGITPRVSIHHGLTMSLYYRDPDDNGVELSIDNVEKSKWHDYMRNDLGKNPIGAPMSPDDLALKYHSGAPEAEIRRFSPKSGDFDPEILRRMIE